MRIIFNQFTFGVLVMALLLWAISYLPVKADPLRPVASYSFSISPTAASASQNVAAHTKFVRILCTATCSISLPVTPVVEAATVPIKQATNEAEYYRVTPGTVVHVAAEVNTGTVYIVEFE